MANLQVRIDDTLKLQAHTVAQSLGMDLPTAIRIFLSQMVRDNALPFRPAIDPFFCPQNQTQLRKVLDDLNNNKNCSAHALSED